jgi:hypothetical protein
MDKSRSLSLLFLIIVFFVSCGKELPELNGVDKQAWIEDEMGCLNKRRGMVQAIQKEKDKLLALDELQVVALLGKPDANELYKRNQKFYRYYLHPSRECSAPTDTTALKLVIRFNAMGLAKEVYLQ